MEAPNIPSSALRTNLSPICSFQSNPEQWQWLFSMKCVIFTLQSDNKIKFSPPTERFIRYRQTSAYIQDKRFTDGPLEGAKDRERYQNYKGKFNVY